MIYVWIQSAIILILAFGGGLWFGGALVSWTSRPAVKPAPVRVELREDIVMPAYHGADIVVAEPEPEPEPESLPLPTEPEPMPIVRPPKPAPIVMPSSRRWDMLYPVNQFGVMSETRRPI